MSAHGEGKAVSVDVSGADFAGQIMDIIAVDGMVPREKVTPDATLEDLGLKSIDLVMILTGLEEKFGVYIPVDGPLAESATVGDLVQRIGELIQSAKHD